MMAEVSTHNSTTTFKRSTVFLVITSVFVINGVAGNCTLPSGLRGTWDDSEKGELTFSNDTVTGYPIHIYGNFNLTCYLQNSSTYIMESTPFIYFGMNFTAYLCWSFSRVSRRRFYLYEHTEANQQAGNEKLKMYLPITPVIYDDICSNFTVNNTYHVLRRSNRNGRGDGDGSSRTLVIVAIVVSVVLIGIAIFITVLAIRQNKTSGAAHISVQPSVSRGGRANVYRVTDDTDTSSHTATTAFQNISGPDQQQRRNNDHPNDQQGYRNDRLNDQQRKSNDHPNDQQVGHNDHPTDQQGRLNDHPSDQQGRLNDRPSDQQRHHNDHFSDQQGRHNNHPGDQQGCHSDHHSDQQGRYSEQREEQSVTTPHSQKFTPSPTSPKSSMPTPVTVSGADKLMEPVRPATPTLSHGASPTVATNNPMPPVAGSDDTTDNTTASNDHFTAVQFSSSQASGREGSEGTNLVTTSP